MTQSLEEVLKSCSEKERRAENEHRILDTYHKIGDPWWLSFENLERFADFSFLDNVREYWRTTNGADPCTTIAPRVNEEYRKVLKKLSRYKYATITCLFIPAGIVTYAVMTNSTGIWIAFVSTIFFLGMFFCFCVVSALKGRDHDWIERSIYPHEACRFRHYLTYLLRAAEVQDYTKPQQFKYASSGRPKELAVFALTKAAKRVEQIHADDLETSAKDVKTKGDLKDYFYTLLYACERLGLTDSEQSYWDRAREWIRRDEEKAAQKAQEPREYHCENC